MQMIDPLYIGIGSAIIGLVLTLFMPVSHHRVNQTLISVLIAIFAFVASFALFDIPLALVVGVGATAVALIYRDILRWAKEFLWHNVYRYTHRYYWYNRVGRAILGGGRNRRKSS